MFLYGGSRKQTQIIEGLTTKSCVDIISLNDRKPFQSKVPDLQALGATQVRGLCYAGNMYGRMKDNGKPYPWAG